MKGSRHMSIKKCFTVILSFMLAICVLSGACGALAAEAGETVEVEFTVLEDTGSVFAATLELQYDHEAFELVPNRIFDSDIKIYIYGIPLHATFRIREKAAPGDYPVTLKILEASDPMGEAVLSPETALVFSEEQIIVEHPPVEVPVYYYDAATGKLIKTEAIMLPAGWTGMVTGNAPEGYVVTGGQSMEVTISEDGQAVPPIVTFWLATPTPMPTATPTRTPTPTATPSPAPTPLVLQQVGGFKAQKTEPTSITLVWNSVPYAQGYRVMVKERNTSNWREAKYTTGTTAQITGLSAGTEYQFKVVAENGSARSESGIITAKTSAATPAPKAIKVGDYITFGHYEQDNNTGNGKEPIEWLVLEVRGDQALVISRYGLDCKPYNTSLTEVTWETCSLREWLNGEFLNIAFNTTEQKAIVRITVDNSQNQGYSGWNTSGGNNTEDGIFLLSYAEANKYLGVTRGNTGNMRSRMSPTAYALYAGAGRSSVYKTADGDAAGWWWLRSPGYFQDLAAFVDYDGSLYNHRVYDGSACVRPALWVNLGSDIF